MISLMINFWLFEMIMLSYSMYFLRIYLSSFLRKTNKNGRKFQENLHSNVLIILYELSIFSVVDRAG
jgi:hypothetical protein